MLDGEMKPLRKLKFVQRKYEDLKDQTIWTQQQKQRRSTQNVQNPDSS